MSDSEPSAQPTSSDDEREPDEEERATREADVANGEGPDSSQ